MIGAGLALAYFTWLLATARPLGFPRDEGIYFQQPRDYVRWWRRSSSEASDALKRSAIDGALERQPRAPGRS